MYRKARIELACSYDSDADAAYIYLQHPITPSAATRMVPFDPTIGMFNLDLDTDGHVLGLEILGGQHLPPTLLAAIMNHSTPLTDQP